MKKLFALMFLTLALCAMAALSSCDGGIKPVHNHKYRYSLVESADGNGVDLVGLCSAIGCPDPHYIEHNVAATVTSNRPATCLETGERNYCYDINGGLVTLTVTLPLTDHYLGSKSIDNYYDEEGRVLFGTAGINIFEDMKIVCNTEVSGYFDCSICEKRTMTDVYIPHEGVWRATDKVADCENDGEETLECSRCLKTVSRSVPAMGHDYLLSFDERGDGKTDLVGRCRRENCKNPDCFFGGITELTVIEEREATCASEGVKKYSFKLDGELKYIESYTPKTGHTLGGRTLSQLLDADGRADADIPGVIPYSEIKECEESANGYFICDLCREAVEIEIAKKHEWLLVEESEASCEREGVRLERCLTCGLENRRLTSKGHLYKCDGSDRDHVYVICDRGDAECSFERTKISLAGISLTEKQVIKTASCSSEGEAVFSFEYLFPGDSKKVTLEFVKKTPKSDHYIEVSEGCAVLSTELCDGDGYFDVELYGINLFAGEETPGCGETTDKAFYLCAMCEGAVSVKAKKYHDVDYVIKVAPTCESEGEESGICKICDSEITRKIPISGHAYEYLALESAPTLEAVGWVLLRCDVCDHTFSVSVPKIVIGENATVMKGATESEPAIIKYIHTTETGVKLELVFTLN